MTKSKWRTITVNLTDSQYRHLKALAGLKAMSSSAFVKYLLEMHIDLNKDLVPYIEGLDKAIEEYEEKKTCGVTVT